MILQQAQQELFKERANGMDNRMQRIATFQPLEDVTDATERVPPETPVEGHAPSWPGSLAGVILAAAAWAALGALAHTLQAAQAGADQGPPAAQPEPVCISGIYPHLAVMNHSRECGIGAVVPWAGRLWMVTYSPHRPLGSDDRLYEIDRHYRITPRPESVGGTPAGRMIHRESNQLIIAHYLIDAEGRVRVIPPQQMPGRITAIARHLTEPERKVYFITMEEGLYEVDVHKLEVHTIYRDRNASGVPDLVPGYHGKGGYTAQGRLVISNNGERGAGPSPFDPGEAGCLAEWDGEKWQVVERRQFNEVTGPGGILGNASDDDPLWATGWDKSSVILKLLDRGRWSTFRLPKASFTYDARHGWYTEWPRIRPLDQERAVMTAHGMFWQFPLGFSRSNTRGIRALATHHQIVADFCMFDGRVVLGCDHHSAFGNPLFAQAQSNLQFVDYDELSNFGPPVGYGGVWLRDRVKAGTPSDPFLLAGFARRVVHAAHGAERAVSFQFEVDRRGNGRFEPAGRLTVPPRGYAWHVFAPEEEIEWVRVRADQDCDEATVHFHVAAEDRRPLDSQLPMFASLVAAGANEAYTAGLVCPRSGDRGTLQLAALRVAADGQVEELGYYEMDPQMHLRPVDDALALKALKERAAVESPGFQVDRASVVVTDRSGRRLRLPKGHAEFDRPFACGWARGVREIATERDVFNCHGTFYELPRPECGGMWRVKPICTHNRRIYDYCIWRGLLVIAGCLARAEPDGHYFASRDGRVGLWFGATDDLWKLGKPHGTGGPWLDTAVKADTPSDPYLMAGYDRKSVSLSHQSDQPVRFTLEVDFVGDGTWKPYRTFEVPAGKTTRHEFAPEYSAHWIRVRTDHDTTASVQFIYD